MNDATHIYAALTTRDLEDVRTLFLAYAHSLGWDLTQGGHLADEVEGLPGPYAQPAGALLLACVADVPVGVLGMQPIPAESRIEGTGAEGFAELKRLFVRPDFRRHGVGLALMKRSEEEARARGYEALVLTTSAEMMPLAQQMYERLGYQTTEPYRNDMNWPGMRWLRLDL